MKIGLLSKFSPELDGIGRIYCPPILEIGKEKKDTQIITIGSLKSDADYNVDLNSISLSREIKKIIKKEKLDALHIQYIGAFYSKILVNANLWPVYLLKIPIVTTMHEVQCDSGLKEFLLSFTERVIMKNSQCVIVHGPYQKKYIKNKYHAKNVKVVHTGMNLRKGASKKGKNLIFFGMYSNNKGIDKLILAMRDLPDFKLTIAGSVPDNYAKQCFDNLKKLVEINNLKNVTMIGKSWISDEEKSVLFGKSNIVIIPYNWGPYNSGLVQDAAEYFLPHVVNKVGAIWEVTDKFKMGEITINNSPDNIASAVKKVYESYTSYLDGLKKYREQANWSMFKKKHYNIYKEAT